MATTALKTQQPTNVVALDPERLIASAIEHNVSVESLERLLAMREQLRAERAREDFSAALAQFQRDIPAIPKSRIAEVVSKKGGRFSYAYANLQDILKAIGPTLSANGLSVTFDTAPHPGGLLVTCAVHHCGGHSQSASFPIPVASEGRMSQAQEIGSSLSYGRRYALTAALGIVTADDESRPVPPPQSAPRSNQRTSAPPRRQPGQQQPPQEDIAQLRQRALNEIERLGLTAHAERLESWLERAFGTPRIPELSALQLRQLIGHLPQLAAIANESQPQEPKP